MSKVNEIQQRISRLKTERARIDVELAAAKEELGTADGSLATDLLVSSSIERFNKARDTRPNPLKGDKQ